MKLLVLSDLHLEFAAFAPDPAAVAAADVVVLAGDIHQGSQGIEWGRRAFPDKPIVYVAGNHEFYGQHWTQLLDALRLQAEVHGVHFLENDSVTIQGTRFLGCSLWTDFEFFGLSRRSQMMRAAERGLNDFRRIEAEPLLAERMIVASRQSKTRLTATHTLRRHQDSLAWLKAELLQCEPDNTVVVTHHYPHQNSTHPRWAQDDLTAIFGSKLPHEILLGASLWIHGHSHDSCNYRIGDSRRAVRVFCNPRGYPLGWHATAFENAGFDPGLLLEVGGSPQAPS